MRALGTPGKERPAVLEPGASLRTARDIAPQDNNGVMMMGNSRASVSRHFQSRSGNSQTNGGNVLPRYSTAEVAKGQAEVLQLRYGELKSSAKRLAADAGTCERSARNHLAGVNAMNLTDFFNACQRVPELRAWAAMMIGLERDLDPQFGPQLAAGIRAIVKGEE